MTQDELWQNKYQEVVTFIETNKRNPSKHSDEERGRYLNWLKHNRKPSDGSWLRVHGSWA